MPLSLIKEQKHVYMTTDSHTHQRLDRATWWGCGSHIPGVLDSIPEEDRCVCEPKVERDGKQYPPMAKSPN